MQAASVGTATAAYLPSVTASWQGVRDDQVTDVSGHPALSSANRSTIQTGTVSLNWVLFDFGGRKAALRNAQQLLEAARANQDATLQDTFSRVAADYYAAQAAAGKLAAAEETEQTAHDSFVAASARVRHGVAAITDQLQAQTSYAQATYNRAKAEGELQTALGTLASDMNLNPARAIVVPSVDEGVTPDSEFKESVAELIDEAERSHPSVLTARAQLASPCRQTPRISRTQPRCFRSLVNHSAPRGIGITQVSATFSNC
ncbi:TolC family protein [Paraburkholderia phymatum]|uniref:TolC family protein n=1 Tax=Paraburkholderia phymatum TaxID=148447 RepID=A0ACC6U841_9BURK